MTTALMHLDGCHFYIWVSEDGRVTYDERTGQDLALHRSKEPCERCEALIHGGAPRHEERTITPVPDDSHALILAVFEACADIG